MAATNKLGTDDCESSGCHEFVGSNGQILASVGFWKCPKGRQVVSAIFDLLKELQPHFSKQLLGSPYLRLVLGESRVICRFDDSSVTSMLRT